MDILTPPTNSDTPEVYDPRALVNVLSNAPAGELMTYAPQPLDQNPAAVYLAGLNSARSRTTQRQALQTVAEVLTGRPDILAVQWQAVRFQHTAALRAHLAGRYAPATANRLLCAVRGVLKSAWRLGLMTAEEYRRAADIESVTGETLPAGRALAAGEIAALLAHCENDQTPAGARDAALICCMYPAGLRREEVVNLDLADFDPETGALTVRHGKRNKARITYLVNGARRALADWIGLRGNEPGPLFFPINKGGRLQPRRMTHQAVYNTLAKRGELAGVKDFSPHDLRRTFISDLLDAGADIAIVAKLAGHASVTTTQRYDRRPEAKKQKAAELLHVPYHGRAG
jgi:integrase